MKAKIILFISLTSLLFVSGLIFAFEFPLKAQIKEGHYRFENFTRDRGPVKEYLTRGCLYEFPGGYHSTMTGQQYQVKGEEKLVVQASLSGKNITGIRYVWVPLIANFEENKSYMLNRERNDFEVKVWIQEVDTGIRVSSFATTIFPRSRLDETHRMKEVCGKDKDPNFLKQNQII